MGLGKTFTGAEKMMRLSAPFNLIICQKSKIKDWIEHIKQNYHLELYPYDLTSKNGMKCFMEEVKMDKDFMGYIPSVGVINYELAWRRTELLQLKDFTLMLDESSLIQNKQAKMTKFILKLNPKNVILLSGTPTSGKYENLWTQMRLLGWDISDSLYQNHYVNWKLMNLGGVKFRSVDKKNPYKNVDRLKRKMREYGCHFLKTEEVMDLPEQMFIEVMVPKSKEYNKFMRESYIEINKINLHEFELDSDFYGSNEHSRLELVGDTSLTKRLYARQLCGLYSKEKFSAFKDLMESTNDRIIVFYNFTDEMKQLYKIAHEEFERPCSLINGEIKNLEAYETCEDSVTFVQYQAGSMGLNLQKANKIVYFTLPERSEFFEQSKKRIHRIGQNKSCFYYIMMCEKSIEEDIYSALKMRRDYTDKLFEESENGFKEN